MTTLPLIFDSGHLFVKLDGALWLLDTGAPSSFGKMQSLDFAGKTVGLASSYSTLTAETLSEFTGVACWGLLGMDVLGQFDLIFDIGNGVLTASTDDLTENCQGISMQALMTIPTVTVDIGGKAYQMFFDTGAQISYFTDESLTDFPHVESVTDFYPAFGEFETDTYDVPVNLGDELFTLRCGRLPDLLGMSLLAANTQGIIGNQVLIDRVVGFFPRKGLLCL